MPESASRCVVGVAGKYCAGKTLVVSMLIERGFNQIDVDALGHEALVEQQHLIVQRFGDQVVSDGAIDRRRLGALVFSDAGARRDLEAIVHPPMVRAVEQRLCDASGNTALDAALLFRMGLQRVCDAVVWVSAPLLARLQRARRRDGASLRRIVRVLRAQRDVRRPPADRTPPVLVVHNSGGREQLAGALDTVLGQPALERCAEYAR